MLIETCDQDHSLALDLRRFIAEPAFPCVGAKSAMARNQLAIVVARDLTSAWDDLRIYPLLLDFVESYREAPSLFRSFAVVFEGPRGLSEAEFEHHLWVRAQSLSDKDAWNGKPYDQRVSADPHDTHFSLSFGGEAFFIVGLHPRASRPARRFAAPVMIFNLHDQFEQLRLQGAYDRLRSSILSRDVALAGSINPMLSRFGEASEARQYSGRAVEEGWSCPFQRAGSQAAKAPAGE